MRPNPRSAQPLAKQLRFLYAPPAAAAKLGLREFYGAASRRR
jgi:hypothetical protein